MVMAYFEKDDLKKLSNFELVKRQYILSEKISLALTSSSEIYQQLLIFLNAYDEEIERREYAGELDEDELDEQLEEWIIEEERKKINEKKKNG